MKNIILFFILIIAVSSCISKTAHQEELTATRDSINAVVQEREAEIDRFISDFNAIQANLDSIKQIEKMVSVKSKNREITSSTKDEIVNDLKQLQQLLNKNKELIANLKNMRIVDSRKINGLQNTVARLEKQLNEKNTDVTQLNERIESLNINVSELKSTIDELNAESQRKSQELLERENSMNKAYYIVSSSDSLLEKELVEKAGGFLGLGRTLQVSKNLDKSEFTEVDIRSFNTVTVNAKKAKLLTVHPADSYHFVNSEDGVDSFVIDDPSVFWSVSRYLVIAKD